MIQTTISISTTTKIAEFLVIIQDELQYQDQGTSVAVIQWVIALVYGFGAKSVAVRWNLISDHQVLPENSKIKYFLGFPHYMKQNELFNTYRALYQTTHTMFQKLFHVCGERYNC